MLDVAGFIITNTNQPRKKDVKAKIVKIFKFEKPFTFKINKSLLFLILII